MIMVHSVPNQNQNDAMSQFGWYLNDYVYVCITVQ